jgi:tetratricopeptide (TPR) repeat protein
MKHTALLLFLVGALIPMGLTLSCASAAASGEEYYSIGMAYFEMGKFAEAERWLNRARAVDKTQLASVYNLGRIAFATGRFEDAARLFEGILDRDANNVMALQGAAYSRIRLGELEKAEEWYRRVLEAVPDSADDGYNHALVLMALGKSEEAEGVLLRYPTPLVENRTTRLLYARSLAAQDKVEAVDVYASWLETAPASDDLSQVRYEYALLLEKGGYFARAIEELQTLTASLPAAPAKPADPASPAASPKPPEPIEPERNIPGFPPIMEPGAARFHLGRLLLTAGGGDEEGLSALRDALASGFNDWAALESLAETLIPDLREDVLRLSH